MKNKTIKNLLIITFIATLLRIIFLKKYPIGVDSFHFLEVARDCGNDGMLIYKIGCFLGEGGLMAFLAVVSILTIILFYFLCRTKLSESSSFYAAILFAVSPLVFSHTRFSMIDKNPMALFMIILLFLIFFIKINDWIKLLLFFIASWIFRYTWDGWTFMFFLILCLFTIKYIMEQKYYLFAFSLGVFVTYMYLSFFDMIRITQQYVIPQASISFKPLVTETYSTFQVGFLTEYIIIAIAVIYLIVNFKKEIVLASAFGISLFFFINTFRFSIFFIPMLYLTIGKLFENIKKKQTTTIVMALLLIIGGFGIYSHNSIMNDDMLPVMDYINKQPQNCLICVWDKGHLFRYYTNKTVIFKASPNEYRQQIDYFVNGKQTDCLKVFSINDIPKLRKFTESANISTKPKDFYIIKNINNFTKINDYYIG